MKMFKVCEVNLQNANFASNTNANNFAGGTNSQNGEANANSQNANFGTGTGTSFANAVNSVNTMQSGDGVFDFTLTEAYAVQREHAQNGISTTIVKDERSPGGYIVTQSQEAHVLPSGLENAT